MLKAECFTVVLSAAIKANCIPFSSSKSVDLVRLMLYVLTVSLGILYVKISSLLLSSQSEADSLPGLEILANDVKCSHGATTSKIDDQELFYLQSRGISQKIAEKLIVLGFFEEIISRTNSDQITDLLRNEVSNFFTNV